MSKGSIWVDGLLWHTLWLELVGQVLLTVPQDAVAPTRHALLQTSTLVCRGKEGGKKKALRRRQEINGINQDFASLTVFNNFTMKSMSLDKTLREPIKIFKI